MPSLGLKNSVKSSVLSTPGIIRDSLVLKHDYNARTVVPVSDGAAYFDGSSYIEIATGALDISTTDFSVTAWIMPNGNAEYDCVFAKRDSDNDGFQFDMRSGANAFGGAIDDDDSTTVSSAGSAGSIPDGTWHHVCAVVDRSDKITYSLDGVISSESGSITSMGSSVESSSPFVIGAKKYANDTVAGQFNGYICNVGLWSATLTQAQIKSIMWKNYAGLTSSETTNLVSWWNLDSTIDSTATLGHTVVYDNHNTTLGSNIATDGTMTDISNWATHNTPEVKMLSTTQVYAGTQSIYIEGNADHDGIRGTSTINTVIGKLYKISCFVYVTEGVVELNPGDGPFGSYSPTTDEEVASTTTNQWEELVVYTFADDATKGSVVYITCRGGAAKFYVDNVKLEQVQGNPGGLK